MPTLMELLGKLAGSLVTKEELEVLGRAQSNFLKEKGVQAMTDIREDIEKLGKLTDNWIVLREVLRQVVDKTHPIVVDTKKAKK